MVTTSLPKKRVFISFDYDHDEDLKTLLVGQSKHEDSPFEITDYSIKEAFTGDWKEKARKRIKQVGVVAVICGKHTDTATGVSAEITIAQKEGKPYFLFGVSGRINKKPKAAKPDDIIHPWSWKTLERLIHG